MTARQDIDPPSLVSSAQQPLRLKSRSDLDVQRQSYQGRDYWVVKDPISLKYYRFEAEEFELLNLIDGERSPEQIVQQFEHQFAPQTLSVRELFQFAGMLHRNCLVVSPAPGQGRALVERGEQRRRQQWRQSLTNVLAIRYRGFDPDRLLDVVNRWVGWCFSWPAFLAVMLLGLAAGGLMFAQFEQFQNKLPSFGEFFAARNWIWLAVALAASKVLHEFGHGVACKRFGGQCHEMGFMLLVMTPCLYVNVSDAWLIPSKWKRAAIAAAGMYAEFVLAAMAVFVWWFSQPGLINQLALNLIFVSSVSTVLFNANPLLRYDGYYILSDLLEIPNLRSKATRLLQRTAGSWLLGIEPAHDSFLPARSTGWFVTYSVAAALYRWLITFSIFWFVYRVLEPYGLQILGQLIAVMAIYGLVGAPIRQMIQYFSVPGRTAMINPVRATVSALVAAILLVGMLLIPIPHYVYCPFYAQAADAKNVFVDVPGSLAEIYRVESGFVRQGDPIVGLHSQQLRGELATLCSEVEQARVRLNNLKLISHTSGGPTESLRAADAAERAAMANFEQRLDDEQRLLIRAPIDGYFLTPTRVPRPDRDAGSLTAWYGSPLEPRNLGAHLEQSTLLGQVIPDRSRLEAVLAIDQENIELVRSDQTVAMLVDQVPGRIYPSRIDRVTPTEMKQTPRNLSSRYGGPIVTDASPNGVDVPRSTRYLVKVSLGNPDQRVLPGSTGTARIHTGYRTIGQRLWRLTQRTFQFEL